MYVLIFLVKLEFGERKTGYPRGKQDIPGKNHLSKARTTTTHIWHRAGIELLLKQSSKVIMLLL